jgi:WD40 repeat protein
VLLRGDGSPIARREAHDARIYDIDLSPDETIIATASDDRTARLWSAAGEPRGILAGHRANVSGVRFTPTGDRIVTTSADNTARLWSATGMLLGELTGHTNVIIMAAIRADGGALATASWDHTAMVWDLSRAQELRPILAARGAVTAAAFDPDGRRLAIARLDGTFSIVDIGTGAVTCAGSGTAPISQLGWSSGEQLAAARSDVRSVELWSARRCVVESTLEHPVAVAALSARSRPRLTTVAGGAVHVWRDGRLEARLTGYPGGVQQAGVDGDVVYAVTGAPSAVVIDTIGDPARRRILRAGTKHITDVRFDREHGRVIAASNDQFLYVWDAATGALVRKLEGTGPLRGAPMSPDGALVIGVGGMSPVVWDRTSGARLGQLEGHADLVQGGEFIDDRLFVSVAANHTALIWDVETGRPLTKLQDVDTVVVSEDRRSVALVGETGVRVWSPRTPAPDLGALRALHSRRAREHARR